jgi:RNA ligase
MTHVSQLFDPAYLEYSIRYKYVSARRHPRLPLTIYNYMASCQFENYWTPVTTQCRGLILDDAGNIVARPFKKFFNLNTSFRPETHEANLPKEQPEVYDKLDGSLGILWFYEGEYGVATRGSFESQQSKWATKTFNERYLPFWQHRGEAAYATYLFEIIFNANKIVVDYPFEDLVLLAVVNNLDGSEWPYEHLKPLWPWRVVERFDKTLSQCVAEQKQNSEGYILFYRDAGLRVKVKFAEYMRLHKLFTGVSPKMIWEVMKEASFKPKATQGYSLEELIDGHLALLTARSNQSFENWVTGWRNKLLAQYYALLNRAILVYDTRIGVTRKDVAEHFLKFPDVSAICFNMLDNNGTLSEHGQELVWKACKPKVEKQDVFRKDIDL